jgi:RNA polymerase sigma factor (sigma-70 family)
MLMSRLREAPVGSRSFHDAFAELVQTHHALVYGCCRRRLPDHHLAQDVTQDVFLQTWRTLTSDGCLRALDRWASLDAWLIKIAHRGCLERLARLRGSDPGREPPGRRSHHRRTVSEVFVDDHASFDEFDPPAPDGTDPHEIVVLAVQLDSIRQLLEEILTVFPERLQRLYRLYHREGVDGESLARALGVSRQEVSRLKHDLSHHLAEGVVANLVARDGRDACSGSSSCLDSLLDSSGWVSGPLPRRLVTAVTRHITRCPTCTRQRDLSRRTWQPALAVVLLSPEVRRLIADRLASIGSGAAAPRADVSGQSPSSGPAPAAGSPRGPVSLRPPAAAAVPVAALLLVLGLTSRENREPVELRPTLDPTPTASTISPRLMARTPLPDPTPVPGLAVMISTSEPVTRQATTDHRAGGAGLRPRPETSTVATPAANPTPVRASTKPAVPEPDPATPDDPGPEPEPDPEPTTPDDPGSEPDSGSDDPGSGSEPDSGSDDSGSDDSGSEPDSGSDSGSDPGSGPDGSDPGSGPPPIN